MHGGEDRPLVVTFVVADRGNFDIEAHDLLHCQDLRGDAPGLEGPGEGRDVPQQEVKENTSYLYDQL